MLSEALEFEMALSSRLCHSPYINSLNSIDNKFAHSFLKASTKSSDPFALTSRSSSYGLFSGLAFTLVFTLNNQVGKYTDKNSQKTIKLALDYFL